MKNKNEKSINYILVFTIIFLFIAIIGCIIGFFYKKENDDWYGKKIEHYSMDSNKMLKDVLLGKGQFYYYTGDGSKALFVSDVTKLFDQEDTYKDLGSNRNRFR